MPLVQSSVSVAGASVVNNVLEGTQYLYCPYDAFVEFGLVGDADAEDLQVDVYTGADVIAESMTPSAQNRTPVYPDDYTLNDVVAGGELIKVRVRNTNPGVARTLFYAVKLQPL